MFEEEDAIGLGIIIRDENGIVLLTRIGKKRGETDVIKPELIAAREGVKLALKLGWRSIILEGDSKIVFENIESSSWDVSYNGTLIHDICSIRLRFDRFKAQYVYKNENRIVDALAHYVKFVRARN